MIRSATSEIADVLLQHVEEVALLWERREWATRAPNYTLDELAEVDRQIDLHLEGLRASAAGRWDALDEEVEAGGPGETFAAGVLAFEEGARDRIGAIVKAGTATKARTRGLVSALGWIPWRMAEPHVRGLLESPWPSLRMIGVAAAAVHRHDPGRLLDDAVVARDSALAARAVRTVGELGILDRCGEVAEGVRSSDPGQRFWAGWTLVLRARDPEALQLLSATAEQPGALQVRALQLASCALEPSDARPWLARLAADQRAWGAFAAAAGMHGDPAVIPSLIERMGDPAAARAMGGAFSAITGVRLSALGLTARSPEGFESGPSERPEEEDVRRDPDDDLDWPDVDRIARWWTVEGARFQPGTRYIDGRPITLDWLRQVLRLGSQTARATAALELALRSPRVPLFEVRGPAWRQVEDLRVQD